MGEHEKRLREIKDAPISAGKRFLAKYLKGEKITHSQAIKAKCCDCMGYYYDGRFDCKVNTCPLYGFMQYRGRSPKT